MKENLNECFTSWPYFFYIMLSQYFTPFVHSLSPHPMQKCMVFHSSKMRTIQVFLSLPFIPVKPKGRTTLHLGSYIVRVTLPPEFYDASVDNIPDNVLSLKIIFSLT
jgi:hypothetical protein